MRDNERRVLTDGIRELGLSVSPEELQMLDRFIDEIVLWNRTYKLVAAEGEELIRNHLLDSLAPLHHIEACIAGLLQAREEGAAAVTLADLGSGNGFPGVPLAVMAGAQCRVRLVERSGRRVGFLRNVLAVTGLGKKMDIEVIEADIGELHEQFDLIVFRAFRPLPEIASSIERCLSAGGIVLAYKGRRDVLGDELEELERAMPGVWESSVLPVAVPGFAAERTLCRLTRKAGL